MAQWQMLSKLCQQDSRVQERVIELYRRINFPYKFRSHFATWIEQQEWSDVDVHTEAGSKKAENLFKELMLQVSTVQDSFRAQSSYVLEHTLDFCTACIQFKQRFEGNYAAFVSVINSCLAEERLLIESCTAQGSELRRKNERSNTAPQQITVDLISSSLVELQQQVLLADSKREEAAAKQHDFILKFTELSELAANLDRQVKAQPAGASQKELEDMKSQMEKSKNVLIFDNFKQRNAIADVHIDLAMKLADVLKQVWAEADRWNDDEKRAIAALANPIDGTLNSLDRLFDEGGKLLCDMVQNVSKTIDICEEVKYNDDNKLDKLRIVLKELKEDYLVQHLRSAFVIDRHTDRVLKVSAGKSLGFSLSVRILGGSGLALQYSLPTVKLSLFYEREIPDCDEYIDGVCQINNGGERKFTINRGTRACTAQFNSIQLKNVRRPDRGKNEELVTEHKYAFVFYCSVHICEQQIPLRLISLPVILTSQTSQEIMARGTLIWDAAFSSQDRKPFEYRDQVTWAEVASLLATLFQHNTGRELEEHQLNYLARTAFRSKRDDDFDAELISEKQVIREKLAGRDFSFWKWFWANMNLVKNYVCKEWQDGLIYGFISKDEAKRKLCDSPCGTFLLRFSESNIENSQRSDISGFLTLAVVELDPKTGQKKLFHVKEYLSPKDLQEKGLTPILDAMEVADYTRPGVKKRLLRFVWPDSNRTFEDVFSPYIKEREQVDDGYHRGKYSIEIFLTDDHSRRNRHDSVDTDQLSCPSTPYTPSAASVASAMSPPCTVDNDLNNLDLNISLSDIENMYPLTMAPTRQTAQVRPQPVGAPNMDMTYDEVMAASPVTDLPDLGNSVGYELALDADNDIILQQLQLQPR